MATKTLTNMRFENYSTKTAINLKFTTDSTLTLDNCYFDQSGTYDIAIDSTVTNNLTIVLTNGTTSLVAGDINNNGTGTVTIQNNINLKLTVKDSSGSAIANARVLLESDAGAGDAPYQDSVTITRSGSTATVTHTAHGLATGEMVVIRGADQYEYNNTVTITVTSANAYTYTVTGTPVTPATGTIVSSQVFLSKLTTAGGIATEVFNFSIDQAYKGTIAKGSTAPYYKRVNISGTITSAGIDLPIQMSLDQ